MAQIEKMIAKTFMDIATGLETGSFGARPKIAVTGLGSEHGEANSVEAAVLAADRGVDVTLIGTAETKNLLPLRFLMKTKCTRKWKKCWIPAPSTAALPCTIHSQSAFPLLVVLLPQVKANRCSSQTPPVLPLLKESKR